MITPPKNDIAQWSANLTVDLPKDDTPILFPDNMDNWKEWGNILIQTTTFDANSAPDTKHYDNIEDWAKAAFSSVASL
jgi:hypothetical protein